MLTLQIKLEEVGTLWLRLDWFGCFKLVICIFTTERFLRIHNTSALKARWHYNSRWPLWVPLWVSCQPRTQLWDFSGHRLTRTRQFKIEKMWSGRQMASKIWHLQHEYMDSTCPVSTVQAAAVGVVNCVGNVVFPINYVYYAITEYICWPRVSKINCVTKQSWFHKHGNWCSGLQWLSQLPDPESCKTLRLFKSSVLA